MAKGVTIYAKMDGGKDIDKEADKIGKSVKDMGKDVDDSGKEAEKSSKGWDLFRKKTEESSKAGEKHHHILGKVGGALGGAAANLGSYLGVGGAAYGVVDAIKTGAAVTSLEMSIKQAMKNTGQYHAGAMQQIVSATEASSLHGGFARTEQLKGILQLTTETGSYSKAIGENQAVTNLARGAHLEYAQALKMVAMGATGSTGRLQKYLGIIQPVKTYVNAMTEAEKKANPLKLQQAELLDKQATALKIKGMIEQKYAGQTQAYNKTAAGQLSNLHNLVENLSDKIGKALLPVVLQVGHALMSVVLTVVKDWPQIETVVKPIFHTFVGGFKDLIGVVGHSKVALATLGVVLGILSAAWVYHKIVMLASTVAEGISTLVTDAKTIATAVATTATWAYIVASLALNVVLGLSATAIIAATGGLVLLGVAVYMVITHWKQFSGVLLDVWNWIKSHWPILLSILIGPMGLAIGYMVKHWTSFVGFFESLPGKIASAGKGMWDFLKEGFKAAIDFVISLWNKLTGLFKIPGMHVHTPFGAIGWGGTGRLIPAIPMLAQGGNIMRGGTAIVGDQGPEILHLPTAAKVLPLTPAARGNNGILGSWSAYGSGDLHVHVELDRRELGQAILREFQTLAARQ